jgi:hypothetical protein
MAAAGGFGLEGTCHNTSRTECVQTALIGQNHRHAHAENFTLGHTRSYRRKAVSERSDAIGCIEGVPVTLPDLNSQSIFFGTKPLR